MRSSVADQGGLGPVRHSASLSRARAVVSPEIVVPEGLDRGGLEHFRQRIEALLNRFCDEADAWAASGTSWKGQVRVTFRSNERIVRRFDGPHEPSTHG